MNPLFFAGKIKGLWKTKDKIYCLHGSENGIILMFAFVIFLFSMFKTLKRLKEQVAKAPMSFAWMREMQESGGRLVFRLGTALSSRNIFILPYKQVNTFLNVWICYISQVQTTSGLCL